MKRFVISIIGIIILYLIAVHYRKSTIQNEYNKVKEPELTGGTIIWVENRRPGVFSSKYISGGGMPFVNYSYQVGNDTFWNTASNKTYNFNIEEMSLGQKYFVAFSKNDPTESVLLYNWKFDSINFKHQKDKILELGIDSVLSEIIKE